MKIQMMGEKSIDILGVGFSIRNYQEVLQQFESWIVEGISHQVCIANVHTVITCLHDQDFRDINNRSLVSLDGLPLVWYANWVLGAAATRVCGPDLMLKCLDQGRSKGWRHFFLGGKPDVLEDLVSKMRAKYPGVEIVGWHSPPFRPLSAEEDAQLVSLINDAKADFLWVGLGAPKQEKWIDAHLSQVQVPVQVGVGAAFDFHSERVPRAPLWMQKNGLEWLFRMWNDKRLFKRYLTTNPIFLVLLFRDLFLVRLLKYRER
ncbi:WecB/TagA/CpsF family glycosyltransferase [Methylomonas rhizoryzae]|uniref:WecB/TagA/CpsF family glycosyltransferase n=1 Tax=Methylomonas rhizoryzae TaxID=2608981 RepID=UPI0012322CB8|nr:WecB/TagA/CpsF family glycosyltransferase [Methylomonas rhizoryzae]